MPAVEQYPFGVGGITTRALESGSGPRPVLCLHGAGSRADRWRPQFPLLTDAGYHVYAIDLPGHGMAEKRHDYPYGAIAFSEVVEKFIERYVEGAPVIVLGTSLGGHVAATLAGRRPDLVRATVLIGAVGLVARGTADRPQVSPIVDPGPAGVRRKLEFLVHDQSLVNDTWIAEELRINSSPGAAEALAAVAAYAATRQDHELAAEALAASGVPTLLCWGAEDRWVPLHLGEAAAAAMPGVELVTVPDAGHAPYFERPVEFWQAIEPFMTSLDPSAAAMDVTAGATSGVSAGRAGS
ncbi:alpha/beta fold hydrolase [soil metagenome]